MKLASFSPLLTGQMTHFEAQALTLDDPRPHPHEDALSQLGHALMNEVLDVFSDTALEDFQSIVSETLIGAFHSAGQRIEREADRARDDLNRLSRDFDGSEIADTEMQEATRRARAADVATMAIEFVRDSAAASYTSATGEVWTPWRGSVKASRTTAALIEARDAIRSRKASKHAATDPGATIIAFRASPMADTADDANRIFDALNWARAQWPDMALATTGAKGAEKLAIKWAKSKNVTLVLAKADFDRHGRAAPFRANDEMLELEPVCVLTLANTLNPQRGEGMQPFGPALNLGQKATEKGIRHVMIKARP
jgi:YspA, cpYpsA-related SLOG family